MSTTMVMLHSLRETTAFNLKAIEREIADLESLTGPSAVDELRARAMAMFYCGFFQQARPLLNALVACEPTERNVLKLAQTEQRLGNVERATAIARRVIETNSQCFAAYEILANALLEAGEFGEAKKSADLGLALSPNSARMKAVVALAEFAGNRLPLRSTGNKGFDALLSELFIAGAGTGTELTDLVARFSEKELGPLMSRVEMV